MAKYPKSGKLPKYFQIAQKVAKYEKKNTFSDNSNHRDVHAWKRIRIKNYYKKSLDFQKKKQQNEWSSQKNATKSSI